MRIIFATILFVMAPSLHAETLSFSSFRLELDDGWVHDSEGGSGAGHGLGERVSIYRPDGMGNLKVLSLSAPDFVSKDTLRNITNVDFTIPLAWQNWGDFSGYQYDYSEAGSFYRQWWLVNDMTVVFVTYSSTSEPNGVQIEETNRIVNSITPVEAQSLAPGQK
jgi:hypothetical protein